MKKEIFKLDACLSQTILDLEDHAEEIEVFILSAEE